MVENVTLLNTYLNQVEQLTGYSIRNAIELKRMYNQVFGIISNLPKSSNHVYNYLLKEMQDNEHTYELAIDSEHEYITGHNTLIANIRDAIQSYTEDNNLTT